MRRRHLISGMSAGIAATLGGVGRWGVVHGDDAPSPPAIDTHIHVFGPAATTHQTGIRETKKPAAPPPADWQQVAPQCGVRRAIVIESSPEPKENQRLLDLADAHPWIVGIIGRLPIGDEGCGPLLHRFATNRRFRGIRLKSDAILTGLDRSAYLRDVENLAAKGLVVDVIGTTQLLAAGRLAVRLPQLRVILEHMAAARITGDKPDPRWLDGIAAAAQHPNTFLKVSHVIQSADGDSQASGLDRYSPWLEAVWKVFGDDRVLFGTDWPVSSRHATYKRIHDLVRQFVTGRGDEAARLFFTDNARRVYGVTDPR
jgi:L-fuconolactonase